MRFSSVTVMDNVIELPPISKARKLELERLRLKAYARHKEAITEMMRIDEIIGKPRTQIQKNRKA